MHLRSKENKIKVLSIALFFFLCFFSPHFARAATLSVTPATGSFESGERVTVRVLVTSNNVPFNAVSGVVAFPTSLFSVESVSKKNSVLNFWVTEPSINGGLVKFEGIALGGSTASSGTVVSVTLRAVKKGEGQISFKSGQILANDGEGTDITGNLIGASFSVKDALPKPALPKVEPKPEPQPLQEDEPVIVPEIPQPLPTLAAPEIMVGVKYGAQAIIGASEYPKAQALVTFVSEDGVKIFILGDADADGSFNLLVPNSLRPGLYKVSAIMIKEDKTNSETSNTIFIKTGTIFSGISREVYGLIGLLIALIVYLFTRIIFHFKKGKSANKNLKSEIRTTGDLVHKSFDILREDVTEYDTEKLGEAEHKRLTAIKKDINDAEKIIAREIKDIE